MNKFMNQDFLLETKTARHLFHDYAEQMPLIDYHCHISPQEIYENRRFEDLTQVWLGGENPDGSFWGDHYKWRLMRSHGISEDYITGHRPGEEKLKKFASALEMAIGNPMYHWCHLELRKYFNYDGILTPESAAEVWSITKDKLKNDARLTVRGLLDQSNVVMIGTTDDPIDSLEWHEKIAADPAITVKVYPSFRPDKVINIQKDGFREYMAKLAGSVGKENLTSLDEVCVALTERLEFFRQHGCRASDHGLDYIPYRPCSYAGADAAYRKAMSGEPVSQEEAEGYQSAILLYLGRAYDTQSGMEAQMTSLANLGLLGNFVGMLTDSRSFLSYVHHDYFRRILCNLIGKWVEAGEYPNNDASLCKIIEGISFRNAQRYFAL